MSSEEQHTFEESRRSLKHLKKEIQDKRKRELKEFTAIQRKREEQKAEEERMNLRKGTAVTKKRANKGVTQAQVSKRYENVYFNVTVRLKNHIEIDLYEI